jgi:hypothetical protein
MRTEMVSRGVALVSEFSGWSVVDHADFLIMEILMVGIESLQYEMDTCRIIGLPREVMVANFHQLHRALLDGRHCWTLIMVPARLTVQRH